MRRNTIYYVGLEIESNECISKLKATEDLIIKGEKYIHLSPTLTDEHFEATMYQYLRVELNAMKQSV